MFGVALSTTFVNTISASFEISICSFKSSGTKSGSVWSPVAAVVTLLINWPDVNASTVAVIFKTAGVLLSTSPISHNPDPGL